jgi:hypothetical protein
MVHRAFKDNERTICFDYETHTIRAKDYRKNFNLNPLVFFYYATNDYYYSGTFKRHLDETYEIMRSDHNYNYDLNKFLDEHRDLELNVQPV